MDEIRRYLELTISSHTVVGPFLQTHGSYFNPQTLPKGIGSGRVQVCYANSYRLLKRHGKRLGLAYAEGYAISSNVSVALSHAWCVDRVGNVFDPTWKIGVAYFGVALKTEYVMDEIEQREKSGNPYYNFLDDWRHDFPLIKKLVDHPEVWKHDWEEV